MKHCILVKWKNGAGDKAVLADKALKVFRGLVCQEGFYGVRVLRNCTDRANRFDILIEIDMEKEKLECYDTSDVHKAWLSGYSGLIESKAIFDYE